MKLSKFLLGLALILCNSIALADPPATVGRLSFLAGTVSFAAADNPGDWGVAPLNRPVTTGDRLWADRDGRVEIRIGPNAIRAAAMTSVDVLRLDDDVTHLRLAQGTLNVRLRQLDAGESFEISTPAGAVLLSRPGSYRVTVDPSGTTATVTTRQGEADVLTGNTPFTVRDNQTAAFSAQGQEFFTAAAPDEFDHFAAARDRAEERIVATRYVPPAMTGYEDLDQHGTWHTAPEYGNVWIPAAVPAGWAPYRYGRWVWVSPWGWTWVDNAAWGFAPYHYGRWVWWGHRWAWAPGPRVARPVYAPALVAFVGGANWSVSVSSGPAVAWVPLGWREPYIPWYRHSHAHVRNINITHVTNINVINHYHNTTHARYVNRDVHNATTVVKRDTFVRARHVHDAHLNVPAHALAHARISHQMPVARPERQSVVVTEARARLPAAVQAREVVAAREPVAPARRYANDTKDMRDTKGGERARAHDDYPRVRVLPAQNVAAPRRVPEASEPARQSAQPTPQIERPAAPAAAVVPPRQQNERREQVGEPTPTPRSFTPPPAADPAAAAQQEQQGHAREQARQQQQAQEQQARAAQQAEKQRQQEQARQQQQLQEQQARAAQQEQLRRTREQAQQQDQQARALQQEQQRRAREQAQQQQQLQEQQARMMQQEQQRRAREQMLQAQQAQQQRLQAQKEQHHQEQLQRSREVQHQRERQYQQAQQVDQQRQQQHEQRQRERAERQRQAQSAHPAQSSPPPQQARRGGDGERERTPQQR